eukprot:306917-Hanusia_phi.AAC.2
MPPGTSVHTRDRPAGRTADGDHRRPAGRPGSDPAARDRLRDAIPIAMRLLTLLVARSRCTC